MMSESDDFEIVKTGPGPLDLPPGMQLQQLISVIEDYRKQITTGCLRVRRLEGELFTAKEILERKAICAASLMVMLGWTYTDAVREVRKWRDYATQK